MHRTARILWRHRQRTPFNSATLTTAGGLVFVGDWNGYVRTYDEETHEPRWRTRLPTSVQGIPIGYAAEGRQYVAIPVGVAALALATISAVVHARGAPPRPRQRHLTSSRYEVSWRAVEACSSPSKTDNPCLASPRIRCRRVRPRGPRHAASAVNR